MSIRSRIRNWFGRRYGDDELGLFLYIMCFVLLGASFFPHCRFLMFIAGSGFIYTVFRTLSSNIEKRSRENERFLRIFRPFRRKKKKEEKDS